VIEKDKENYNAWLFTGAAAQELGSKEQALAAYQRAIQISSNQPTAWQVK
jgi:Tfp pilus assembly protein PilF